MVISANAERWRAIATEELQRQGVPLPVDLILSLIDVESGGHAGAVHPGSKASGLGQVLPATLADYNKAHAVKVSLAEMQGKTEDAARKQIRVSIWVLAMFWKGAFAWLTRFSPTVDTNDLARFADLFYRAGPGATRAKLSQFQRPTWELVSARFAAWEPLRHVRRVFDRMPKETPWNLADLSDWLQSSTTKHREKTAEGFVLAAILLLLALWYFKKTKKGNQNVIEEKKHDAEG